MLTDIEDRAGVAPLDALLAERGALVSQYTTLRAKYGPGDLWGHIRKMELARIAVMLRAEYLHRAEKVTETRLDDEAHAHPDYIALVTLATTEAARYVALEEQIRAIDFTIQRGNALLRYAANEPR